jgi:release factor glutamine methyltransferase
VHPERLLDVIQETEYARMIERCCHHEPVTKIIGEREFWALPFFVTCDTLDPRPESETLIEAVLNVARDRPTPMKILDLGVGSGCLLIALLKELPHASGVGIDRSEAALGAAKKNIERHGLSERASLVAGSWLAAVGQPFDVIISNPPYIRKADIPSLDAEVKAYDPLLALDGGEDGLQCYEIILEQLQNFHLMPRFLFFEIGAGQESSVISLLRSHDFEYNQSFCDLSGISRCIVASPLARNPESKKSV